jgi:hypothetical protein
VIAILFPEYERVCPERKTLNENEELYDDAYAATGTNPNNIRKAITFETNFLLIKKIHLLFFILIHSV